MLKITTRPSWFNILLAASFVTTISLLLIQYFLNRSLWVDESMLAISIVDRGLGGLMRPLQHSQVAPILFLWLEKAATWVLGNNEMGLRLVPLLSAIASLPLLYRLTFTLTGNKFIALMALLMLGLTPAFIYYSSEVKQYSSDVLVILVLYNIFFDEHPYIQKRRILLLSVAGVVGIFLSNVSVIALVTLGFFILYRIYKHKKEARALLIPALVWVVCLVLYYCLFIYHHPAEKYMKKYWKFAFIPLHSWKETWQWLNVRGAEICRQLLYVYGTHFYYWISLVLSIGGLVLLAIKKNYRLLFISLLPLLIHITLSALKFYPFEVRLILYQAPLCIMVLCFALYYIAGLFRKIAVLRYLFLLWILTDKAIVLFGRYPMKNEEFRSVVKRVQNELKPNQSVYLYYGCVPAFHFYQRTGVVQFKDVKLVEGKPYGDTYRGYLYELQPLTGETWVLFSRPHRQMDYDTIYNGLLQRGRLIREYRDYYGTALLFDLR